MPTPVAVRGASNLVNARFIDNDNTALAIGYSSVRPFIAAATLLIGDSVYLAAAGTAAKSASNGDYATALGVVVGGFSFDPANGVAMVSTLVGQTAALVGELVWVAMPGSVVYAVAGAAIVRGAKVGTSATSGRVDDLASGNVFGMALEAASTTGDAIKILVFSPAGIGASGGTPITGSGTAGKLPKFSAAGVLTDSIYTESATVAITDPAATAATNSSPYGYSQAQADALITAFRALTAKLRLVGIIT